MELNILWFVLITVLFTGYFFLEGFDFGVGTLLPFLGKDDAGRRLLINSIGPFWDGNEVWLITAGGAIFAAFPNWYATLFSGFYMALFLMLLALILRGVAFEFRSKDDRPAWRSLWDWMIFGGSLVPALLWGVAITNLLRGVPIAVNMQYAGTFWDLLSPYTLVGGLTTLFIFTLHGALFLTLKTSGQQLAGARRAASLAGFLAVPALLLLVVLSYSQTDLFEKTGAGVVFWGAVAALVLACGLLRAGKYALAFAMNGLAIVFSTVAVFWGLFPRVMVSSLNPDWSLTIYNASSSPYTLKIMTIVALTLVPVVLLYQGWNYWIFRQRVTLKDLEY
ncbi:cytochrome d ubiquinol oxidase subunit II [Desulfocucumis palustris]|uniref:Cytochrome d ubiquinol oxidase subunit II n=1 Tax=Desulfocucumis palustris TaxID=1898651 RepID=A0A2L2XHN5_9FIRM|nr:cytochrome d ubiquinol oxidase subunit II [Desulfocucumis palustris]GBF35715.1 cytochrome d ubiquinol oxidase subunit II [Desulfocucumis palustris]